jgi:hypothetical protein
MEPSPQVAWNVFPLAGKRDPRNLIARPLRVALGIGFIRITRCLTISFRPLTRPLIWFLRNLSILLENAPSLAACRFDSGPRAKPPRTNEPATSLFAHESLRGALSVVIPSHNEEMNIDPLVSAFWRCRNMSTKSSW